MNSRAAFSFAMFALAAATSAEATVQNVSVTAGSFNPSLGQTVTLTFQSTSAGAASVVVLDRDGYLVKTLAPGQQVVAGKNEVVWDGRDKSGQVVADEAYSFKIDISTDQRSETYFPALATPRVLAVSADRYDRRTGMLSYTLDVPCRVHIQAGSAALNAKTGSYEGPVLKTIVDREPRPSGALLEFWNGLDESALVYVPDQPNFVTAILATTLPENSVISFGNKRRRFVDGAASREGKSLIAPRPHGGHEQSHHQGLQVLEDLSPALVITPANGSFDEHRKGWTIGRKNARLHLKLSGPSAAAVSRHPGRIVLFVDRKYVAEVSVGRDNAINVPARYLRGRAHLVTVNWQSRRGPLAVNSVRLLPNAGKTREGGSQ